MMRAISAEILSIDVYNVKKEESKEEENKRDMSNPPGTYLATTSKGVKPGKKVVSKAFGIASSLKHHISTVQIKTINFEFNQ